MSNDRRVPQKDSLFDSYIRNTSTVLAAGTPTGAIRLGLTTTQSDQWLDYRDQWIDIYPKYTDTAIRTKAITNTKNSVKKSFTSFAILPLNQIAVSPNITANDRLTFNLPERDATNTKRGGITDNPFGKLKGTGGGGLEIRARREEDATRSSMHPLADAVEFRYAIIDKSAANPADPADKGGDIPGADDLTLSSISKKSLWKISLGTKNQGKRIIGYLRWVNLSNPENNSDWSDLITTIIS